MLDRDARVIKLSEQRRYAAPGNLKLAAVHGHMLARPPLTKQCGIHETLPPNASPLRVQPMIPVLTEPLHPSSVHAHSGETDAARIRKRPSKINKAEGTND
jgi:hypothetical protein